VPESPVSIVRNNLRARRLGRLPGLRRSQADLAERLGLYRQAIAEIEAGKRNITVDELVALAYLLDVTPSVLLAPGREVVEVPVDEGRRVPGERYVEWLGGSRPLPGQDRKAFHADGSSPRAGRGPAHRALDRLLDRIDAQDSADDDEDADALDRAQELLDDEIAAYGDLVYSNDGEWDDTTG
jgi:transcriptional regulator with XRE-family HTH domain